MPFILALSSILSFCSDLSSVPEWVEGVTYDFPVLLTEGTICTWFIQTTIPRLKKRNLPSKASTTVLINNRMQVHLDCSLLKSLE